MYDIILFKKLGNGNYAAPRSHFEISLDEIIRAIQEHNDSGDGKSMYFNEGGDVCLTDSPSIALGAAHEA